MRTTIDIDDQLLRTGKARAAERGWALGELINQALRLYLDSEKKRRGKPFVLIEAGREGGRYPSPSEVFSLLEDEEGPVRR